MQKPFDGAITAFFENVASAHIKSAIETAKRKDILDPSYPYRSEMPKSDYQQHLDQLQLELAKFHNWVRTTGRRVAIIFEGRDAAGKGGTIARLHANMPPRSTKLVALSKPTETEAGQWYFQRYVAHLPTAGTLSIFDRSWYNRGVVEKVFGFCTDTQREQFFDQVIPFEQMIEQDGVDVVKLWLNVGQAEQLRRFLDRERDPLKQWKLSSIDVKGLHKWDEYTSAIRETLTKSDHNAAPWIIVRSDDKRRARIAAIQQILTRFEYTGRDDTAIGTIDNAISGGAEVWNG
jgi:polyphosphate kinase 2